LFRRLGHDQARDLRALAAGRRADQPDRVSGGTRVIAVTSGKGGVGKTSLTVNLACALAALGKQVIILDCDLGTANVDVMLGMHPSYSLQHVLSRQRRLDEVMSEGPHGVRVISGGSGFSEMADLSDSRRDELLNAFAALEGQADVLLLDTGAGISANVLRFVAAAGEALVVTTPEPTAVTDAYALIKVVTQQVRGGVLPDGENDPASRLRLRLVVNQATSEAEAQETATNIVTVAQRFLGVEVQKFGSIPADRSMAQAVRRQTPAVDAFPNAPAALAIQDLARRLLATPDPMPTIEPAPLTVEQALEQEPVGASTTPSTNGHARGGFGAFVQRFLFGSPRSRMAS